MRQRHPLDRRGVLVSLTEPAPAVVAAAFAMFVEDVQAAMGEAHPEHVPEFAAVLAAIAAALRARTADPAGISAELAERGNRAWPTASGPSAPASTPNGP